VVEYTQREREREKRRLLNYCMVHNARRIIENGVNSGVA
jgi:hypothetical protein